MAVDWFQEGFVAVMQKPPVLLLFWVRVGATVRLTAAIFLKQSRL